MPNNSASIVFKVWNYAHVLKNAGSVTAITASRSNPSLLQRVIKIIANEIVAFLEVALEEFRGVDDTLNLE